MRTKMTRPTFHVRNELETLLSVHEKGQNHVERLTTGAVCEDSSGLLAQDGQPPEIIFWGHGVAALSTRPLGADADTKQVAIADERLGEEPASATADAHRSVEPTVAQRTFRSLAAFLEPAALPANDDREAAGAILRALRSNRGRAPLTTGIVATALWLGVCIMFYFSVYWRSTANGFLIPVPQLMLLASAALLAVIFLIVGAAKRAEELQATTRCLIKVVADLVEPQAAEGHAATIKNRVQAEVGELDLVLDNTLRRIGTIGADLSAEHTLIEQAAARSERSFRGLLNDLSSERAAIVTNAEKLRSAISGAHQNLSRDLDSASDRLARLITDAGAKLISVLDDRSAGLVKDVEAQQQQFVVNLASAIETPIKRSIESIDTHADRFTSLLDSTAMILDEKLTENIKEADKLLERQTKDLVERSNQRIESITAQVNSLLIRLEKALNERAMAINEMLASRTFELGRTLKDSGALLGNALDETSQSTRLFLSAAETASSQLEQQIVKLNDTAVVPLGKVAATMDERGRHLSRILLERFGGIDVMLNEQSERLLADLNQGAEKLKFAVTSASQDVRENYASVTREAQATLNAQTIKVDNLINERLSSFENTIEEHRAIFLEEISEKTTTLMKALDHHRKVLTDLKPMPEPKPGRQVAPQPTRDADGDLGSISVPFSSPNAAGATNLDADSILASLDDDTDRTRGFGHLSTDFSVEMVSDGTSETAALVEARKTLQPVQSIPSKGWLSDLLARASVEDVAARGTSTALTVPETHTSLGSLSSNVRSYFLVEALPEAWDNHRLGRDAAFDPAYTSAGRLQLYRLRNRLKVDRELRQTIEHYVLEFERLLQAIQDDLSDEEMVDYLSTDMGLVYTILAESIRKY